MTRTTSSSPLTSLKRLLAAFALIGTAGAAQAEEGSFGSITYGKTQEKISKSSLLDANLDRPNAGGAIGSQDNTWGVRAGRQMNDSRYYVTYDNVSGTHSGIKLRQENLLGSYDKLYSLSRGTQLFAGGSAGLTKLSQESSGFSRDTNVGYTIGGQVGVIQKLSRNLSLEGGYRYLRTNASVEMARHGGPKAGSMKLDSSSQTYLAANYTF